jgi:hypothetical protein
MSANTFIELNDTPSSYTGHALKWLRVQPDEANIGFWNMELGFLTDIQITEAFLPQNNQALVYNSSVGKWRPASRDIYAAGFGLRKDGLSFSANVTPSGGLISDSAGLRIAASGVAAGTYGNGSHIPQFTVNSQGLITAAELVPASGGGQIDEFVGRIQGTVGQITVYDGNVLNGTGPNANITVNLVATGVSAGTYGNSTSIPQITVDTYGRVESIVETPVSGAGGNIDLSQVATVAFATISVPGQGNIVADAPADVITFIPGSGINIVTNPNLDSLTISAIPQTLAFNADTLQLSISQGNSVDLTGLGVGGGSSTLVSNVAPVGQTQGTIWWNNEDGRPYIRYSSTWVDFVPSGDLDSGPDIDLSNISADVVPGIANTYDLGSIGKPWRSLHVSGETIYIGGEELTVANGNLRFGPMGNVLATQAFVNAQSYISQSSVLAESGNIEGNATEIDITKTTISLEDGFYFLPNGNEGQVLFLTPQTGATSTGIAVLVESGRVMSNVNTAAVYANVSYSPFSDSTTSSVQNVITMIYTDGAWQASSGTWD